METIGTFSLGEFLLDQIESELRAKTEGMSLPEIASLYDITLVFNPLENSKRSMVAGKDDASRGIIIDPSLRKEDQCAEFYKCLTIIELDKQALTKHFEIE